MMDGAFEARMAVRDSIWMVSAGCYVELMLPSYLVLLLFQWDALIKVKLRDDGGLTTLAS